MATRKPARKTSKKREDMRQAEQGVKSAQRLLADFIAKADPESVKKKRA